MLESRGSLALMILSNSSADCMHRQLKDDIHLASFSPLPILCLEAGKTLGSPAAGDTNNWDGHLSLVRMQHR
jgi:hypothetical protein